MIILVRMIIPGRTNIRILELIYPKDKASFFSDYKNSDGPRLGSMIFEDLSSYGSNFILTKTIMNLKSEKEINKLKEKIIQISKKSGLKLFFQTDIDS